MDFVAPFNSAAMNVNACPSPELTIEHVAKRIVDSGKITRADARFLHGVMTSDLSLSTEGLGQVRRILDRLQSGMLKIAD